MNPKDSLGVIMSKQRSSYPLRAPEEVMKWLKDKAKTDERSLNFVIVKELEKQKNKKK